jgi:hypothetical protein
VSCGFPLLHASLEYAIDHGNRHLTVVTSQLEHYESLLRDIYPKFDLEVARYVDQALGKVRKVSSVVYNQNQRQPSII